MGVRVSVRVRVRACVRVRVRLHEIYIALRLRAFQHARSGETRDCALKARQHALGLPYRDLFNLFQTVTRRPRALARVIFFAQNPDRGCRCGATPIFLWRSQSGSYRGNSDTRSRAV